MPSGPAGTYSPRMEAATLAARALGVTKVYGQGQAAASALASRPEIVFADEPTGNLDSKASAQVLGLLRGSVREFGQTVVMVTHDPVAASYADQVVFLADSRIAGGLARPTPESVLD